MSTTEKIRIEENEKYSGFRDSLPSRAKYFQTESDFGMMKNAQASRYTGFKLRGLDNLADLEIENEELKRDINTGNPDILPTGATLKMLRENAPAKPFDDTVAVSYKVNAKGKLFFALYALLVLSLILVIVLNALAIERQKAENAALENQITLVSSSIDNMMGDAENLNNEEYIQSQATSFGMKPVKTVNISINTPYFAEFEEYKPVTNWFDGICDFLS